MESLRTTIIFGFLLATLTIRADSWGPPREFSVISENKKFAARIVPGNKDSKPRLTVRSIDGAKTNEVWNADLSNRISPTDAYVSDDGQSVVTLDNYFAVGYGDDVVAIYSPNGQLAKYSLEQFAPPPARKPTEWPPVHGGYEGKFIHSTASRHWRQESIQFFHREGGEWFFCLWLDWDMRWVMWRMVDGQAIRPTEEQAKRLNAEGRRRALEQVQSAEYPAPALNFLGRLRFNADRPLVEAWLRDPEFSGGGMLMSSGADGDIFAFTVCSRKREAADRILARWDGHDQETRGLEAGGEYRWLGTLKCRVTFPTAPAKSQGLLRLYLIPEATPLSDWALRRPEHYLIADLRRFYPRIFKTGRAMDRQLEKDVDFIIYGITPGKYRLKVAWDKVEPFTEPGTVLCKL